MRRSVSIYCEILVYRSLPKRKISSNLGGVANRILIAILLIIGMPYRETVIFVIEQKEIFLKARLHLQIDGDHVVV